MKSVTKKTWMFAISAFVLIEMAYCGVAETLLSDKEKEVHACYTNWLFSLDSNGYPQATSAEAFSAFLKAATKYRDALEAERKGRMSDKKAADELLLRIGQINSDICPLKENPLREEAIAFFLEGEEYWPQAAEKIAQIPENERTLCDNVLRGYAAFYSRNWSESCNSFDSVNKYMFKSALLNAASKIAESHPDNPQAILLRADALYRVGLPAASLGYMRNSKVDWRSHKYALPILTLTLGGSGALAEVNTLLEDVKRQYVDSPIPSFLGGVIALASADFQKATNRFSESLLIDADFLPARNARGIAFMSLEKYDNAIRDFNDVLSRSPSYESSKVNILCATKWRDEANVGTGSESKGLIGGGFTPAPDTPPKIDIIRAPTASDWKIPDNIGVRDLFEVPELERAALFKNLSVPKLKEIAVAADQEYNQKKIEANIYTGLSGFKIFGLQPASGFKEATQNHANEYHAIRQDAIKEINSRNTSITAENFAKGVTYSKGLSSSIVAGSGCLSGSMADRNEISKAGTIKMDLLIGVVE